jgi:hypothetical protein
MTTPYDIISRALKDIGALAAGESPSADDAQDSFDMLNDMCAQWSNENMMVFYKTENHFFRPFRILCNTPLAHLVQLVHPLQDQSQAQP